MAKWAETIGERLIGQRSDLDELLRKYGRKRRPLEEVPRKESRLSKFERLFPELMTEERPPFELPPRRRRKFNPFRPPLDEATLARDNIPGREGIEPPVSLRDRLLRGRQAVTDSQDFLRRIPSYEQTFGFSPRVQPEGRPPTQPSKTSLATQQVDNFITRYQKEAAARQRVAETGKLEIYQPSGQPAPEDIYQGRPLGERLRTLEGNMPWSLFGKFAYATDKATKEATQRPQFDPRFATTEQAAEMRQWLAQPAGQRVAELAPKYLSQVLDADSQLWQEYGELGFVQQTLYELPFWALTFGTSATGLRASLAPVIKAGGKKGAAAELLSGALAPVAGVEEVTGIVVKGGLKYGIALPVKSVLTPALKIERQTLRAFENGLDNMIDQWIGQSYARSKWVATQSRLTEQDWQYRLLRLIMGNRSAIEKSATDKFLRYQAEARAGRMSAEAANMEAVKATINDIEIKLLPRGTQTGAMEFGGKAVPPSGDAIAKELGVTFNGIQQGKKDVPDMMLFTDPQTGSTFSARSPVEARTKLTEMRQKFAQAEVTPAPEVTIPKPTRALTETEKPAVVEYYRKEAQKWRNLADQETLLEPSKVGERRYATAVQKAEAFERQARELEQAVALPKAEVIPALEGTRETKMATFRAEEVNELSSLEASIPKKLVKYKAYEPNSKEFWQAMERRIDADIGGGTAVEYKGKWYNSAEIPESLTQDIGRWGMLSRKPEMEIPTAEAVVRQVPGEPEAGLQKGMFERDVEVRPPRPGGEGVPPVSAGEPPVIEPPLKPPTDVPLPPELPPEPGARFLTDLTDFDTTIEFATQEDNLRKLANLPILRNIFGTLNPAAVANSSAQQAIIGRAMLRAQGATKATGAFQSLAKFGGQNKVFGAMDEAGRLTVGKLKGKALNDIRTYPNKYDLTDTQKVWIEQADLLEKEKLALLKRNGIEINELSFEEGGQFAGRRVFAKVREDGELLEAGFVSAGPGRPGAKLTSEKNRVFKTQEEGIAEGFRYLPEEDALFFNLQGAYNRIADRKMTEWLLEQIDWRTTKAPQGLIDAATNAKKTLSRSRQLLAGLNRAVRGERLPDATIASIAIDFPAEAKTLKKLIPRLQGVEETASAVQSLTARANVLIGQSQNNYFKAVGQRARAAEEAARLKFGEARVAAPAFSGKILTGPDAKEIANLLNKSFTPDFNKALGAINKVNALGRFFQLAGDASPFTIQLIFLAGENPRVYARAGGGFVKALFDPTFHAKYLANHAETIQKSESLILAKSGTEFTEALATGGLMRPGIKLLPKDEAFLKTVGLWTPRLVGKTGRLALEPFQRGFEIALDIAGIEMKEALEHLATTPARNMEIDQFVNEFRGLANSARLGVSSTWRQAETATILAPRYNRAIAALLTDTVRGNLRGALARRALAKGIAAIIAMAVVISIAKGEDFDEVVSHLNPSDNNFLTWTVAGQKVGPGSKVRSIIKLWANSAKDPSNLLDFSVGWGKAEYMRNPLIKWIRGNMSPVAGDSWSILTGKDYIGDPTREGLLGFGETIAFSFLLPIWTQTTVLEGGDIKGRAVRGTVEFLGGRAYPENKIWELRADWADDLKRYSDIPSNVNEVKADRKKYPFTRAGYRKQFPEVDAKLFITGQVTSLSEDAKPIAVRLMRENGISVDDIPSLKKTEFETEAHKRLRIYFEQALGEIEKAPALVPVETEPVTPRRRRKNNPFRRD